MPKGYKTLSIKDESWDYAQALFNKQSNRNVSFSSWVSDFLKFSVQKELFFEFMDLGLVVMEEKDREPLDLAKVSAIASEESGPKDLLITLTVIDTIKKEFINVTYDPHSDSIDNEGGYYCEKCKSRRCQHALFVATTREGINQATDIPSAFQNYLDKCLKESKKE